jgi:alpha-1,6-mannosyltransferase
MCLRRLIVWGGPATVTAMIALAVTQAPLGTWLFFLLAAVPCLVYALLLRYLLAPSAPTSAVIAAAASAPLLSAQSRLLASALLFAVAFRVPLVVPHVNADNDIVRYVYDGRLQRLGYNPFTVVPADPAFAATHTDQTRRMPSIRARTPYPAAAQLFFRLVVTLHESPRAMKVALAICDLVTIAVVLAWLRATNRSQWFALVYAWNPLVILEVAHSGHIDALGAMWIALSAWMLSTGRGMRATIAFVLAVATKLLPIVLLPIFWKRVRLRDALIGGAFLLMLYLPFATVNGAAGGVKSFTGFVPLGAVPNVIAFIRFNGPLFKALAAALTPTGAAAVALLAGLAAAGWMRFRTSAEDPAAWAWPMAISLAAAPVIYPWYLLYLTPFLFTRAGLPLIAWTYSALPVYVVWYLSRHGHRWFVPAPVLWLEYGAMGLALVVLRMLKVQPGDSRHLP